MAWEVARLLCSSMRKGGLASPWPGHFRCRCCPKSLTIKFTCTLDPDSIHQNPSNLVRYSSPSHACQAVLPEAVAAVPKHRLQLQCVSGIAVVCGVGGRGCGCSWGWLCRSWCRADEQGSNKAHLRASDLLKNCATAAGVAPSLRLAAVAQLSRAVLAVRSSSSLTPLVCPARTPLAPTHNHPSCTQRVCCLQPHSQMQRSMVTESMSLPVPDGMHQHN